MKIIPLSEVVIRCLRLFEKHMAVVIYPGDPLQIGDPVAASYIVTRLDVLLETTTEASGSIITRSYRGVLALGPSDFPFGSSCSDEARFSHIFSNAGSFQRLRDLSCPVTKY